ncbi:MAG: AAA family ATPase, partial [Candidatus Marsarchaeota archaeon]|nr:AAA family ATPase [Candidatus Marsarchaeota archaeon]
MLSSQHIVEDRKELVRAWLDVLMVDRDLREKNLLQIAFSSWEPLHSNTVLKLNVTATEEQIGCLVVGQALAMTSAKNIRRQLAVGTYLQYDGKYLYINKHPSCNLSRLAQAGRVSEDEAQWRASWMRQKDALDKIVSRECVNPHLPDILTDPSQTRAFSVQPIERLYNTELDESRLDAISAALSTRDLYLIQGPPGTGKTMVISELVAQILTREPKAKILLVSQAHVAVDHALAKVAELLPGCRVARLGREENISRAAQVHTLDSKLGSWVAEIRSKTRSYLDGRLSDLHSSASVGSQLQLADEIRAMIGRKDLVDAEQQIIAGMQLLADDAQEQELQPTIKCLDGLIDKLLQEHAPRHFEVQSILGEWIKRVGRTDDFSEPYLSACSLVAGTCVGIAGQRYLPDRFDWAIVDEAGHATPSEILIPMVRAERCILVGDHKQLPPVVDHILRSELVKRESIDTTWLDRSLFEHLFEHFPDSAKTVLRKQFRS